MVHNGPPQECGEVLVMSPTFEEEVYELHSRLCGGLADPKRILILYSLADRSLNVTELSEALNLPQPTISRHLRNLRERGIVTSQRKSQSVYYTVSDPRVIQALDLLRAVLADMLAGQASLARSVGDLARDEG
jgi:ArsR family transcriptional regulator